MAEITAMSFGYQISRFGSYELRIFEFLGRYTYELRWHPERAETILGKGSGKCRDVDDARYAAVLHLANLLPKSQSERLIASQRELPWEQW